MTRPSAASWFITGLLIFIADRCELYGNEFIAKYVTGERADFEAWSEAYRFDLALLAANSNYTKYFEGNPGWRVIKSCPVAVLYHHTEPALP